MATYTKTGYAKVGAGPTARLVDFIEFALENQAYGFTSLSRPGATRLLFPLSSFQPDIRLLGYSMENVARHELSPAAAVIAGTAWGGTVEGRCYAADLPFLLTSAGWVGTRVYGTDPSGFAIPADVACWQFVRSRVRQLTTLQARVGYAAEGVCLKLQGGAVGRMSLTGDGHVRADITGLRATRDVVKTTNETQRWSRWDPMTQVNVTVGSSIVPPTDFSLDLAMPVRLRATPALAGSSAHPTYAEHGAERGLTQGTVSLTTVSDAELALMMAGTTFALTARWSSRTGSISSPSYLHRAWVSIPACQYVSANIDGVSGRRRRRAAVMSFAAKYNTGIGNEAMITVASPTMALA